MLCGDVKHMANGSPPLTPVPKAALFITELLPYQPRYILRIHFKTIAKVSSFQNMSSDPRRSSRFFHGIMRSELFPEQY